MDNRYSLKQEFRGSMEIDLPHATLAAMLLAINYEHRCDELADHVSDLTVHNFSEYVPGFTVKDTKHLILGFLCRNGLAEVEEGFSNNITLTERGINVIYDIIETNQVPDELVRFTPAVMAGSVDVTNNKRYRLGHKLKIEDITMNTAATVNAKKTVKKSQAVATETLANTTASENSDALKTILEQHGSLQYHETKTEQFGMMVTPRCKVTVYATKKGMTIYAYKVRGETAMELEQINNLLFQGKGEIKKVYAVYRTSDNEELKQILHLA